jgi:hypothetical protein
LPKGGGDGARSTGFEHEAEGAEERRGAACPRRKRGGRKMVGGDGRLTLYSGVTEVGDGPVEAPHGRKGGREGGDRWAVMKVHLGPLVGFGV